MEIAAIMHKSISKDLIMHQRPHWGWFFFFFYPLLGEYKGTLEALALLSLIKSTWGWKLRIWYLWTHASNFPPGLIIFNDENEYISHFPHNIPQQWFFDNVFRFGILSQAVMELDRE